MWHFKCIRTRDFGEGPELEHVALVAVVCKEKIKTFELET